jgi:AraC-like DNA-binding protein
MITVFSAGAIQAFLIAVSFFFRKQNSKGNIFISIFMLIFSAELLFSAYYASDLPLTFPHFIHLDGPLSMFYGPLILWYVAFTTAQKSKFSWPDLLHLIPFAVLVIYKLPTFFLKSASWKTQFFVSNILGQRDTEFYILNIVIFIQVALYLLYALKEFRKFRESLSDTFSNYEGVDLKWLYVMLISGIIIWSFFLFMFILSLSGFNSSTANAINALFLSGWVFFFGFTALTIPFEKREVLEKVSNPRERVKDEEKEENNEDLISVATELDKLMNGEKLYLDPDLTIVSLSEKTGLPHYIISKAINRIKECNFHSYINRFRVEEVKKLLSDPELSEKFTLLALALDSGFKSKSAFNDIFKKFTGLTPTEFKRKNF